MQVAHHVLQRAVGMWRESLQKRAQVVDDVLRERRRRVSGRVLVGALDGLAHVDEVAVQVKGQQWLWELEPNREE